MEFNSIITLLDSSVLERESVSLKKNQKDGVTWRNIHQEEVSVTVNDETFDDVIQVCLAEDGEKVYLYINHYARFKLTKFDLEDVSSFSIS